MSKRDNKDLTDLFERIDFGIRRGVAQALAEHKNSGQSISIWEDGHVVEIPAEKIQISEKYLFDKKYSD
ncbi:MAG: hypothetical protein JSR33_13905 [Proteobacteria bacterium]|nr:hypothetical protein [Pseudomonadota bacterium]